MVGAAAMSRTSIPFAVWLTRSTGLLGARLDGVTAGGEEGRGDGGVELVGVLQRGQPDEGLREGRGAVARFR